MSSFPPSPVIALQLWSLRHEFAVDPVGMLNQVRGLGFDSIETGGTYGWSTAEWKERLAENKLSIVGAHIGDGSLFTDLESQIAFQEAVGNHRYILPWHPEEERTPEGYRLLAERLNKAGKTLKAHNASILYHNHEFEFDLLEGGVSGFDILLKETDPALVGFQLDVYWAAYAGKPPLQFLNDHADRMGSVHAKQIRLSDRSEISMEQGDIDFAPILALAGKQGWPVALEYEGEDAVEVVRRGAAHLHSLVA